MKGEFGAPRTYLQAVRSGNDAESGRPYRAVSQAAAGSLAAKLDGLDLTVAEAALMSAVISDPTLLTS